MEKGSGSPAAGGSCPQKNAEILSSQYGINLFLAGLLLTFAWAVHAVGISKSHLLSYLITLMLIQLLWMLWYLCRSCTQRRLIRDKDTHAGARWLKCKYWPQYPWWHRAWDVYAVTRLCYYLVTSPSLPGGTLTFMMPCTCSAL